MPNVATSLLTFEKKASISSELKKVGDFSGTGQKRHLLEGV